MGKKYNQEEVVDSLIRKHDIKIEGNNIICLTGDRAKNDIGIKSKGKIDFLTNHVGYFITFVDKFE